MTSPIPRTRICAMTSSAGKQSYSCGFCYAPQTCLSLGTFTSSQPHHNSVSHPIQHLLGHSGSLCPALYLNLALVYSSLVHTAWTLSAHSVGKNKAFVVFYLHITKIQHRDNFWPGILCYKPCCRHRNTRVSQNKGSSSP